MSSFLKWIENSGRDLVGVEVGQCVVDFMERHSQLPSSDEICEMARTRGAHIGISDTAIRPWLADAIDDAIREHYVSEVHASDVSRDRVDVLVLPRGTISEFGRIYVARDVRPDDSMSRKMAVRMALKRKIASA